MADNKCTDNATEIDMTKEQMMLALARAEAIVQKRDYSPVNFNK